MNCLFGIPSVTIKKEHSAEYVISEADKTQIRLATGIDKALLAIIRESLQDGVNQAVNEQMNIASSSSLKQPTAKCSTQLVDEVKYLFASEKEEVRSLFGS